MEVDITRRMAAALPEALHPDCRIVVSAGGHVVAGVAEPTFEAHFGERQVEPLDGFVEIGDADLHVEDVLGVQPRYGGAPGVLDAKRLGSECVTELRDKHSRALRPLRVVRRDEHRCHAEQIACHGHTRPSAEDQQRPCPETSSSTSTGMPPLTAGSGPCLWRRHSEDRRPARHRRVSR